MFKLIIVYRNGDIVRLGPYPMEKAAGIADIARSSDNCVSVQIIEEMGLGGDWRHVDFWAAEPKQPRKDSW